jgi:hypothetical protein
VVRVTATDVEADVDDRADDGGAIFQDDDTGAVEDDGADREDVIVFFPVFEDVAFEGSPKPMFASPIRELRRDDPVPAPRGGKARISSAGAGLLQRLESVFVGLSGRERPGRDTWGL